MDKIFDNLYKKFFLRDMLSITFCGAYIILVYKHNFDLTKVDVKAISLLNSFMFIGFSYTVGMAINLIRDIFAHLILKIDLIEKTYKGTYSKILHAYFKAKENLYITTNSSQILNDEYERIVFISQFTGNFTLSLVACFIIFMLQFDKIYWYMLIPIVIGFIITFLKHYERNIFLSTIK